MKHLRPHTPPSGLPSPWRLLPRVALDLIFPRTCPGCRQYMSRTGSTALTCSRCTDQLTAMPSERCCICGEPYCGQFDKPFHCATCRDRAFAFDFAISRYRNTGLVRDMVHRLKYQQQRWLRDPLGRMVAAAISEDPRIEISGNAVLVPVPAHRIRLRERGFNQTREIALVVGKLLQLPVLDCLVRLLPTPRQTRLNRSQRLANLKGAFGAGGGLFRPPPTRLNDQVVILVDDVLTTGATTHHAALAILQVAQPKSIIVATATRA